MLLTTSVYSRRDMIVVKHILLLGNGYLTVLRNHRDQHKKQSDHIVCNHVSTVETTGISMILVLATGTPPCSPVHEHK